MWTLNATFGVSTGTGAGQERLPWIPAIAGVMGVVAIVTVVLNMVLAVSILVHQTSRSLSFHLHIVNMAVMAILQGGGVLPLWTHYLLVGRWIHGDSVCRWWLAADTLATSLPAMALIVTAWDRFIFLACWRFMKEGGKYVCSFALLALAWLAALALTMALTLMDLDTDGGSYNGVHGEGSCEWGERKGERVLLVRLVVYCVGVGLGVGLSLALLTLPCLGIGGELPMDEDNEEVTRRLSLMHDHNLHLLHKYHPDDHPDSHHPHGHPIDDKHQVTSKPVPFSGKGLRTSHDGSETDSNFPHFVIIKKTDRLEERERWKWQVASLLAVSFAWAVFWLPSHLFAFVSHVLDQTWNVPQWANAVAVVFGYTHAAVAPLLWLLHQPVRKDVTSCFTCQCCKSQDDDEEEYYDSDIELSETGPYRPTPDRTAVT